MKATLSLLGVVLLATQTFAGTKEEEVARYIKDLKSKDAGARKTAAEEIGKIAQIKVSAGKPALEPLKAVLKDGNSTVREAAALALGRLDEPKEVVPALTKLLKDDKESSVKIACARGLGQMGAAAKDALPTLRTVRQEAQNAGRAQQRLAQASREAIDAIQSGRRRN